MKLEMNIYISSYTYLASAGKDETNISPSPMRSHLLAVPQMSPKGEILMGLEQFFHSIVSKPTLHLNLVSHLVM